MWMDLEIAILSEVSQTEGCSYDIPHMWTLKRNDTSELTKEKGTENELMAAGCREEGFGEGVVREFGIDMYTLLYLKWVTNKDPLYSTDVVVQSLSRLQLFVTPRTAARQASLSFIIYQSLFKLMSIESMMPSNHLNLCHPLLLLPSTFPSIRVFSNELALCIR